MVTHKTGWHTASEQKKATTTTTILTNIPERNKWKLSAHRHTHIVFEKTTREKVPSVRPYIYNTYILFVLLIFSLRTIYNVRSSSPRKIQKRTHSKESNRLSTYGNEHAHTVAVAE